MKPCLRIGVFGEYQPGSPSHPATNLALRQAAEALCLNVEPVWLSTLLLERADLTRLLGEYAGFWCASGGPYHSLQGALRGIQWIRARDKPLIGT